MHTRSTDDTYDHARSADRPTGATRRDRQELQEVEVYYGRRLVHCKSPFPTTCHDNERY